MTDPSNPADQDALIARADALLQARDEEAEQRLEDITTAAKRMVWATEADIATPQLLATPRADILSIGFTQVVGEASAGKTVFTSTMAAELAMRGTPVVHIDLEMGRAGLKQMYNDILTPAQHTKLKDSPLWHIVPKELFYPTDGGPAIIRDENDLLVLLHKLVPRGGFVYCDGMSEYQAWRNVDAADGTAMRRLIAPLSLWSKTHESAFLMLSHISKEAIKEGFLHARDSIESTNAADGSMFIQTITPYSREDEGGIKVSPGAKRIRGGLGSVEPRYYRAGGQGDRQLIFTPCTVDEIPEGESPDRDAVLKYLTEHATCKADARTKKQIVAATDISDGSVDAILTRLTARDRIGVTAASPYKYYILAEGEAGPSI